VVKRLLQARRQARPATARQLVALAGPPGRWQLHDLARRLEEQPEAPELRDESVPASASGDTGLTPDSRPILAALDRLPEGACQASDRVRTQGRSQAEAAQMLAVWVRTVHRRLGRGLQRLAATPGDLGSGRQDPAGP
jgi:DNA-directed RNA polymerase specialized sigma24 family protein